MTRHALFAFTAIVLCACGESARLSVSEGIGPQPQLPEPNRTLTPTVNIAPARGWPDGGAPTPAAGLQVNAFATGLDHPRWLYVLPNGDVLVAETNSQPRSGGGLRGWLERRIMARAGAGVESADRITLLRDADNDGVAESSSVFLDGLYSPFGMALIGNDFYVANTDAILRFDYETGATSIAGEGERIAELPAGAPNRHWTKSLIASEDGRTLYVGVGSNSNVGENGMDAETGRAAIWAFDAATGEGRVFGSGLRNPVGMDFEPETGVLWTVVNERDELGSDLVPDYLAAVNDGDDFGWPYFYWGDTPDPRFSARERPAQSDAETPDYALGPHTASLGLAFAEGADLGARFETGAFIGQHGSWNRNPHSGYEVIFVPFEDGHPNGPPVTVLTDFLGDGDALGRPVGVVIDAHGALLVADDVGDVIWRVSPAEPS